MHSSFHWKACCFIAPARITALLFFSSRSCSSSCPQSVYFWNPIPPSADYVSLGMVATNTDDPPDLDQVRCIPAQWVVKVEEAPRKVWDDAGLSGRPGSVWEINSMNHFVATVGHDPPQGASKRERTMHASCLIAARAP